MLLKDSVVAAHFSDFSGSRSRIVELKADKAAYVSYRINDKVYWTKKKVRLEKGEKLMTDGVNYARARCGNQDLRGVPGPNISRGTGARILGHTDSDRGQGSSVVGCHAKPAVGSPDQFRLRRSVSCREQVPVVRASSFQQSSGEAQ